nr:MAG TPA: hypothetical protein [Caudoviricetes sp.]
MVNDGTTRFGGYVSSLEAMGSVGSEQDGTK